MKTLALASRNAKELLRDKLTLLFSIGFPVVVLLLLALIGSKVPSGVFQIETLTPGIAVFGLSFLSLFSGMLVAKDRASSLMLRLFTSPLKARHFILGYFLPLLPIALAQSAICYLCALCIGLTPSVHIFSALAMAFLASPLFIAIGLLCGTLLNDKQVGGLCGALLTNLTAWLSGAWFDPALVGGAFSAIANALPFVHAVNAGRAALTGQYSAILPDLWWVIGYAVLFSGLAVFAFTRKMRSDSK